MFKQITKSMQFLFIKPVFLVCLLGLGEAFAQAETPAPESEAPSLSQFDSILSDAYRPKGGGSVLSLTYVNVSLKDALVKTFSFSTLTSTKLASVSTSLSSLKLSYKYSIDENVIVGFSAGSVLNQRIEFNYTAAANANGYTDSTTNKSGMEEPGVYIDYVLTRSQNLLAVFDLGFSPRTGDSSDTNSLSGGSSSTAGLSLYRGSGKYEYSAALRAESLLTRTGKTGSSTVESTGGNRLGLSLGLNIFVSPKAALQFQAGYIGYAASTDTVNPQTLKFENASYGVSTFSSGLQYAMTKDLAFQIGASVLTSGTISTSTATSRVSQDPSYSYSVGLGLKFGF